MSLAKKLKADPPKPFIARPQLLCAPPLPTPMHGLAPRVVLSRKWWDEERQAAYASTGFRCAACGIPRGADRCKHLEGHEVYEIDWLVGTMTYVETVPLCSWCHSFVHPGYLRIRYEEGLVSRAVYEAILDHGRRLLNSAGLKSFDSKCIGPIADWNDWRLVVGEDSWPPIHDSLEAQVAAREGR